MSEGSQSMIDRSKIPDPSNRSMVRSQDRIGSEKKVERLLDSPSEANSTFDFNELGVREDEIGSYLFDYFEKVDNRIKVSFASSNAAIKMAMQGFLTYHYFKLTRIDTKQKAGLICFGCKNPRTVNIVHLSTLDQKDFAEALADSTAIIWKEFTLVDTIVILIKYPWSQASEEKSYQPMDSFVVDVVKAAGFKRLFIQDDAGGRNRVSGFVLRKKTFKVVLDKNEGIVLPILDHDSKSVNISIRLTMLIANQPILIEKKSTTKDLVETEFGPGIPTDYLVDLKAPITLLLAYYAMLYSKWTKAAFTLPCYGVSIKDLLGCKTKLANLKVSFDN